MKIKETLTIIYLLICLLACNKKAEKVINENDNMELSTHSKQELTLAKATPENVENILTLTGKVMPFEEKQVKVSPLVDGIIEKLTANLGDYVSKGQILALIKSTDVADLENQTTGSKTDLISAQKNLQVKKELFAGGLATNQDVLLAQNEVTKSASLLNRANVVSSIYGVRNSSYSLKSPISGFIVEKNPTISDKMNYHEGDIGPFFTIADLSEVQISADVYESDIEKVKLGYPVKIKLIAYPDKIFTGKIDKISNILDPQTRTMTVRINLSNEDNLLKPEMFAQVNVDFNQSNTMVSIPAEAVIFDKNKNFVVVYKNAKDIKIKEIGISQTTNGKCFINSGLKVGDQVMVKNQLMIYNMLDN